MVIDDAHPANVLSREEPQTARVHAMPMQHLGVGGHLVRSHPGPRQEQGPRAHLWSVETIPLLQTCGKRLPRAWLEPLLAGWPIGAQRVILRVAWELQQWYPCWCHGAASRCRSSRIVGANSALGPSGIPVLPVLLSSLAVRVHLPVARPLSILGLATSHGARTAVLAGLLLGNHLGDVRCGSVVGPVRRDTAIQVPV